MISRFLLLSALLSAACTATPINLPGVDGVPLQTDVGPRPERVKDPTDGSPSDRPFKIEWPSSTDGGADADAGVSDGAPDLFDGSPDAPSRDSTADALTPG